MGTAVVNACTDIMEQMQSMASELYGVDEKRISVNDGFITIDDRRITYAGLMEEYSGINQGDVIGRGSFRGDSVKEHPLGGKADFWEFIIMGIVCDIEAGL